MTVAGSSNRSAQLAVIDNLVTDSKVVIVAGPGGVGKTTVAAALGLHAAKRHGRRVLVITVDPARRLAEVLGIDELTEESILVPVGSEQGRLWALMVDMAQSWNALIRREGDDDEIDALLNNPLYQTLTRRFVQSHDYVALDHILDVGADGDYDLIIVDTPPSSHAVDLLDAPGRIIEFFDGALIKWLTAGSSGFIGKATTKPVALAAQRLLGREFLNDIGVFFSAMASFGPVLIRRAKELQRRLAEPGTSYVVVTTTEEVPAGEATRLIDELVVRKHEPSLVILNKVPPTVRVEAAPYRFEPTLPIDLEGQIDDDALRSAVDHLRVQADAACLPSLPGEVDLFTIGWKPIAPAELGQLADLLE